MAEFVPSTPHAEWNAIANQRQELMNCIADHNHSADEASLAEIENKLLEGHAPDVEGVILKLEILFEAFMHQDTQDAFHHLGVIGDLRRLEYELS